MAGASARALRDHYKASKELIARWSAECGASPGAADATTTGDASRGLSTSAAEWVHYADLLPWERNPKHHGDDIPGIARSIVRFGWLDPIVVWKSRGRIVGGHGRALAAKLLMDEDAGRLLANDAPGPGMVPVRMVEFSSEAEANAAGIALNRYTERNPMDADAVAELIREMEEAGASLEGVGYSEAEIATLLNPPSDPEPENPGDQSGELRETFQVLVTCKGEVAQSELLQELHERGYEVRSLIT